jgi:hypothetical protein
MVQVRVWAGALEGAVDCVAVESGRVDAGARPHQLRLELPVRAVESFSGGMTVTVTVGVLITEPLSGRRSLRCFLGQKDPMSVNQLAEVGAVWDKPLET